MFHSSSTCKNKVLLIQCLKSGIIISTPWNSPAVSVRRVISSNLILVYGMQLEAFIYITCVLCEVPDSIPHCQINTTHTHSVYIKSLQLPTQ